MLSLAHAPCLPHFKEGNERQWGGVDFHLLEAQVGQGVEGQETDFRCCSASDLRETISREHRSFFSLLSCSRPRFTSGTKVDEVEMTRSYVPKNREKALSQERGPVLGG